MPSFTHLHTHSHYSLLNALPKVDELVKTAKKYGMKALALTDAGNMYATIEFYKECKKAEIKPIVGVDFYVAQRSRKDMQSGIDNRRTRLVLLAKNYAGYKKLIYLVTESNLEGFYYKPRIDKELMEKHGQSGTGDDLICIIPAFSSDVSQAIKNKNEEKALEALIFYKKAFGEKNVYIEITRHPEIDGHEENMQTLYQYAKKTGTEVTACHDVYYLNREDKIARDTLMLVNTSGDVEKLDDSDDEDFSFISNERAVELFLDMPEALENNQKIVDLCNLEIELGKWVFPHIDLPEGSTPDDELRRIVYEGFARRGLEATKERTDRADYELSVIKGKGYAPYFLIVADLLKFAHENGILSNIRGSVSGSMVTYLSGITNLDPIEYEIPFERFLNPDRPSAPDIDMDYADNRRDEMVEYTRRKYGRDKVAQIGTFGTMAARGSVRDTARAMGFPYELGDQIAKLIPMGSQGFPMTIERAFEESPDLKKLYDENPDVQRIIATAKKIEGCARHISIHAAGVVVAPTELTDFTPLQYDPKGEKKIISQYDMYSIEEAGLLKFDFLGLKNLSIIANCLGQIKKNHGVDLSTDSIPIDDKKTFEMLARGETADTFQLNGEGMTKFLVDLKPTTIHDINAMVALYRPGPIQFIPEYIARKHDPSLIKYLDPALEPILRKTYGILVYQDDLLMMAHKLAGYSWGEVDKFRKAVGKKIPEEMALQKEKFIKGCVSHSGWAEKKAKELWTWIEPFAAYGFNKAHSVSYGRVAYQTAYLKANYPGEYMTAVLEAEAGEVEKVAESSAECVRLGIPVLPPDVNESYEQFTLIKGKATSEDGTTNSTGEATGTKNGDRIRFGLISIKNFGQGIAEAIIKEREARGPFKSVPDFLDRVIDRNLNKKSLEALVMGGAMDSFGIDRGVLLANIEKMLAHNKEHEKRNKNQDSLFGLMGDTSTLPSLKLDDAPKASPEQKLAWEKELLGMYVSGHPLDKYRETILKKGTDIKKLLSPETKVDSSHVVACVIEEIKHIITKKNEPMAFVRFSDFSGSMEGVVFPKSMREMRLCLVTDKPVALKGKLTERNGERSFIIDRGKLL